MRMLFAQRGERIATRVGRQLGRSPRARGLRQLHDERGARGENQRAPVHDRHAVAKVPFMLDRVQVGNRARLASGSAAHWRSNIRLPRDMALLLPIMVRLVMRRFVVQVSFFSLPLLCQRIRSACRVIALENTKQEWRNSGVRANLSTAGKCARRPNALLGMLDNNRLNQSAHRVGSTSEKRRFERKNVEAAHDLLAGDWMTNNCKLKACQYGKNAAQGRKYTT